MTAGAVFNAAQLFIWVMVSVLAAAPAAASAASKSARSRAIEAARVSAKDGGSLMVARRSRK